MDCVTAVGPDGHGQSRNEAHGPWEGLEEFPEEAGPPLAPSQK